MATRSASSALTVSTIASMYGRLMVGPTWTSLICAIVKPSSAAGRLAIGTSTRTTRGDAARVGETPERDERGRDRHRSRRRRDQRRRRHRTGPERRRAGGEQEAGVAHGGEDEQGREQPHANETDPGQHRRAAAGIAAAGAEPVRQRQRRDEQEQGERDGAGERVEPGHETPADIGVEEERDRLQAHRDHVGLRRRASMPAPARVYGLLILWTNACAASSGTGATASAPHAGVPVKR